MLILPPRMTFSQRVLAQTHTPLDRRRHDALPNGMQGVAIGASGAPSMQRHLWEQRDPRCAGVLRTNDRALKASAGWKRTTGASYLQRTISTSPRKGG